MSRVVLPPPPSRPARPPSPFAHALYCHVALIVLYTYYVTIHTTHFTVHALLRPTLPYPHWLLSPSCRLQTFPLSPSRDLVLTAPLFYASFFPYLLSLLRPDSALHMTSMR